MNSALYWVALCLILSPVGTELASHLTSNRFDHYILVPLLCFGASVIRSAGRKETEAESGDRRGLLLLAGALVLAVLGASIEAATLGRAGAALAIIGLGRYLGQFSWATGALLLFAVPIPSFVVNGTTPWLESFYLSALHSLLSALGTPAEWAGQVLLIGGERLELFPEDSGLRLAWVLASIGWFAALPRATAPSAEARPIQLFSAALGGGALGLAAQGPGVFLAAGLVAGFGARAGELWLGTGLWLTTAVLGMLFLVRRGHRDH